jgi:transposase
MLQKCFTAIKERMINSRYIIIMKTYPMELRERVLKVVDQGNFSYRKIASMFNVSTFWICKMLRQRRQTGSIEPIKGNRGRIAVFDEESLNELDQMVEKQCDITLNEIKDHFKGRIDCSLQTISNTLRRLGWSFKKNRYVPRSKIEMM